MEQKCEISGKVLIFTDLHLGLSNNKESKMRIAALAVKEILEYVKKNSIKTIFFLGDWNHSRVNTENQILNVSYKLMSALQKHSKVYLVVGNHDIYLKSSVDINSLVIFKDLSNVTIVDKTLLFTLNSKRCAFVPWLSDTSAIEKNSLDMMFGHFDVSSKYLIKSYVEDNKMKQDASSLCGCISSAGDDVGDFIDCVKKSGTIFSGHIHGRRQFKAKEREFIFVGSPYQQNLGEKDNLCGFYTLDEGSKIEFHEIKSTPKHVEILMSQVIEDDNYDFSIVRGNIVHKVYDIEVDRVTDSKVSQKILDNTPYEEILPEYTVKMSENSDESSLKTIEILKKSKLEYIRSYIESIDQSSLDEDRIEKDKLFQILEKYYNRIQS